MRNRGPGVVGVGGTTISGCCGLGEGGLVACASLLGSLQQPVSPCPPTPPLPWLFSALFLPGLTHHLSLPLASPVSSHPSL